MNSTDRFFYWIGWGLTMAFLVLVVLEFYGIFALTDLGIPCAFRTATGHYCPGCGGTHAVCSLARGQLAKSFCEHAAVPCAACLLFVFLFWNTLISFCNRRKSSVKLPALHFHTAYLYWILFVILIQWIIKLILA